MLTRKRSIVSCFVAGALLCTLTSCGEPVNAAAGQNLTAAVRSGSSQAGEQDIRITSKEENVRQLVRASLKSTEDGSHASLLETAVATIAGASVSREAAALKTTARSGQSVQAGSWSDAQLQYTRNAAAADGQEQVQETEVQTEPSIAPELENKAITTVDTYQNIRLEPSEDSEIVGHLESGSAGDILETKDGWTKISSGSVEGWVHNEYIVSGEAAQNYAQEALVRMATITEDGVRVRDGASIDATWIGVVNAGESYQVVQEETEEIQADSQDAEAQAASGNETLQPETEAAGSETAQSETAASQSAAAQPETAASQSAAAQPEAEQSSEASDQAAEESEAPTEWVKILYDGDEEGYVCADYATTAYGLGEAKSMDQIRAEEEARRQAEEAAEAEAQKAAAASAAASGTSSAQAAEAVQADSGWVSLGEFKVTAYCGGACCNGKWAGTTASGAVPSEGRTIAVAPWIIPYGTQVRIEGMDAVYVAEDTGGFANSNPYQIDLFVSDHGHATSWGVSYREIWVKR